MAQSCRHGHGRRRSQLTSSAALGLGLVLCFLTPVEVHSLLWGNKPAQQPKQQEQQDDVLQHAGTLLKDQQASEAFEDAWASTFREGAANIDDTLQQYGQMIEWLVQMPATMYSSIRELHSFAIRETVFDAMQLAAKPFNTTGATTVLEYIHTRLGQLTSRYGYPATRRIIVGALLKKRKESGPFKPEVQELAVKILLQLFQLHKKSAANKGIVQFFHISKSGGTNLCQSAEGNGCSTQGFDTRLNCLIREFGDQPRWVSYNAHRYVQFRLGSKYKNTPWFVNFHSPRKSQDNCAERYTYLKANKWNFFANEYTVPPMETGMCREFVNLIMFRQPIDRLKSQISWIQKLYMGVYEKPGETSSVDVSAAFKSRTSGFWERLVPAGVSNYYIRSLLGQRFFEFPIININSSHVQAAKISVLQHDLLTTLENKEFNDITLTVGLGWHATLQDAQIRSSNDVKDEISLPIDMDVLVKRNSPDVLVYEFAKELQALDVFLFNFVTALDRKLGLQNMSTDRCGYVSLSS